MATLPTGTVTYLMTDIVSSTRLWQANPEVMFAALQTHDALADKACNTCAGHVLKERGEGDSLFMVFADPRDAVAAAVAFCTGLLEEKWPQGFELRVRAAIHTGASTLRNADYYGPEVIRCARLRSIAHTGQILVSQASRQLIGYPPAGVEFKDLGTHRLKDLLKPESIFEIVHPSLPASSESLDSLNRVQHNLPVQLTSFVGRLDEVFRVRAMLQAKHLVTLTGSGGCGKTRLALQIGAESAEDFRDGVWFVDFTRLGLNQDCASLAAKTLHLSERAGASGLEILVGAFADKRALLIFDNCEHVIDDAADLVAGLLEACPNIVILATSREALRIPGEVRSRVPSLSTPAKGANLKAVEQCDAVKLFCERASLRSSDFKLNQRNAQAVADLCRLLDGIPLAIEQAASHTNLLTPQQMLTRFQTHLKDLRSDDRGIVPRHRTIQATIEWSYNMLSEEEKLVFQRCAIFSGGWSLEAAESVCCDEQVVGEQIGGLLQALIDKSLVSITENPESLRRFRFLRVNQEFAKSRASSIEELAVRHSEFFCGWLPTALTGEVDVADDLENVRTALLNLQHRDSEAAANLFLKVKDYFLTHGHLRLGAELCDVQKLAVGELRQPTMAALANVHGIFCWWLGDFGAAEASYRQSLGIWKQLENPREEGKLTHNLGLLLASQGKFASAREMLESSKTLHEGLNEPDALAKVQANLGRLLLDEGDYDAAREVLEQCLGSLWQRDASNAAVSSSNLAHAYHALGSSGKALQLMKRSFVEWQVRPHTSACCTAMALLSSVLASQQRYAEAMTILGGASAIQEESGMKFTTPQSKLLEAAKLGAAEHLGELHCSERISAGAMLPLGSSIALAIELCSA